MECQASGDASHSAIDGVDTAQHSLDKILVQLPAIGICVELLMLAGCRAPFNILINAASISPVGCQGQ